MPGNEVGDRVHNFFAQDNLSEGQHSQGVDGNWPSNNNLWVGSQKQIGFLSSHPKNYNSPQSESERGHSSQNVHTPHGFNFTQATARSEFGRSESQNDRPNLNGFMYGRQGYQTRPDETNFLGVNTDSDRNNASQRGFSVYDSRQGVNEQISKNAVGMETSETHGSFDLFGGQHQMHSQNPGLLQPLQQQSGFSDIQQLQQQLMFRKMQELQRQKDLRQPDARQANLVNQVSSFARQASGSHSQGLINGNPTSDSSGYPWTELTTANTNWLQRASPAMQGPSSGLAFSPEQGQVQRSMGFVHQQMDQSLYGVPVSTSRGPPNQYPHIATEKGSIQHMPAYSNTLAGSQYAIISDQVTTQEPSRQGLSGKSLFGHTSGQSLNNGTNMEHIQQLKATQQNSSLQEFHGAQDLVGPSDILSDKTAMEATSSHDAASLDPDEEKILFGSDDNIWDAFGNSNNVSGGASNLLDGGEFPSGLPSIQSGSWSALMQSAVAETSSSGGVGLQGEWTGLNLQNSELPSGSRRPSTFEGTGKQQAASHNVSLPASSALNFGSVPFADGANLNDKYQRMVFQQHGKGNSYEHDEVPRISSSGQTNQQSSGGSTWLNHGAQQKVDAVGSQLYQTAPHSFGGEMNAKSMSGHWISQQQVASQPNNKRSSWSAVESVLPPADAALNINESDNPLQQSQINNRKRVMHEEIGHGDGVWRADSLPTNIEPEPMKTNMGSTQRDREGYAVNSAATIPNSSSLHRADHSSQFSMNSHLNYWKHVDPSVKSKGSENSGKRHLNRGPQVSESSFNSSDKEDLKTHEIESSSKRENSNDSYRSSSSHVAATGGLRENVSSDVGDSRSLPGAKQSLSNQVGRKSSGPRKFQYHPMGNLDEDVEMPYGTQRATNMQGMSLHHSLGLRSQDQGYFGSSKIGGQVPKNPAEVVKGRTPDLEGFAKGSDDMRFKGMIPGYLPNAFAPFDRSVGLSTSHKASQPSQNMLELLHKVDQSRDRGTARNFGSFDRNLSSEMPEGENSDGSVGGLQRSQSSNSQGFGLQLGPPSQRLSLPNHASPSVVGAVNSNPSSQAQASPDIREKSQLSQVPPSQEPSHGEHKNDRTGIAGQTASDTSVHKMPTTFSSALGTAFQYPRSQLQNQTLGAKGHGLINHSGKEFFDRHSQVRHTDETGSWPPGGQSTENDLRNAASTSPYDIAVSRHERVQSSQTPAGEKLPAVLPHSSAGMSQRVELPKMLPNVWSNVPTQQHLLATQAGKGHSNLPHPNQLNIVESTSVGLQRLEDQQAEKRDNNLSKFGPGSLSSQGLSAVGEKSTRDGLTSNVSSGKADHPQVINGQSVKESCIKPTSDASLMNPTATQMDLEAFGRSLKPNNFHQSYALLNQMKAMKNLENDPSNREFKRLKGSDNYLGDQQVTPLSGHPNEHNNMVGDVSTFHTTVPLGDPQMLSFSGVADNVEHNVPSQPRNLPSKDLPAFGMNESQNHVSSNNMAPVKVEHSHISPQMAPSWFDQYGTFKNGQMLPRRVDSVKIMEKPFSLGKLSGNLETHNSKQQVNVAANTSQASVLLPTPPPPPPPPLATEQFPSSPLPANPNAQNLVAFRPKKRKRATADLHSWLKEVSGVFRTPQGINSVAAEWSTAANRLMEKVDDDGEVIEDTLPMSRPKRRLILTTQLSQQLLRPPPATILSAEASSNYESVVYHVARQALADACNLVSSVRSRSSIPHSGTNSLSDESKQCGSADDHLSAVMEELMSKAKKIENDFLRLDKRSSVLDLRLECQDIDKFTLVNRFARFHGRSSQTDGPETSPSDAAANAPKLFPQRYVTAVPLPKSLPDRVQCLSL